MFLILYCLTSVAICSWFLTFPLNLRCDVLAACELGGNFKLCKSNIHPNCTPTLAVFSMIQRNYPPSSLWTLSFSPLQHQLLHLPYLCIQSHRPGTFFPSYTRWINVSVEQRSFDRVVRSTLVWTAVVVMSRRKQFRQVRSIGKHREGNGHRDFNRGNTTPPTPQVMKMYVSSSLCMWVMSVVGPFFGDDKVCFI